MGGVTRGAWALSSGRAVFSKVLRILLVVWSRDIVRSCMEKHFKNVNHFWDVLRTKSLRTNIK